METNKPLSDVELRDTEENDSTRGNKTPQYLSAIAATTGACVIGSIIGWSSPMLPLMTNENSTQAQVPFHVNTYEAAWIGSLIAIGGIVGALPAGIFANVIGRKNTFIIFSVPWILSWYLIINAKSVATLYISRFLSGVVTGVISTVVPTYISEIAEDSIRGGLGSLFQLFLSIGVLFSYIIGAFRSYSILAISCTTLTVIFVISVFFIPESPVHLLSKNKPISAARALRRLRGPKYDIAQEIETIKNSMESTATEMDKNEIWNKENIRALIISLGLMTFQQLSGINAVIFYSVEIFEQAGSNFSPSLSVIIVGIVQVLATVLSVVLVDKAGRRFLLLFSDFVMALCLGTLGLYFLRKEKGHDIHQVSWVPLCCVVLYFTVYSVGLGPIPWIMSAEIFPPSIRSHATGAAVALNWTLAFIVTRFFGNLRNFVGEGHTYIFFTVICFVGTIFIFLLVPETKGKSIQEIQEDLAGKFI